MGSHMRGKLGEMDIIADLCEQHGVVCAVSSQSYKMINSGEGGFLLTDDADIAAKCAVYAGAYEGLPVSIPNYSVRMSNLAAAVVKPQIKTLDERIEKYNARYNKVASALEERMGDHLTVPKLTPDVT